MRDDQEVVKTTQSDERVLARSAGHTSAAAAVHKLIIRRVMWAFRSSLVALSLFGLVATAAAKKQPKAEPEPKAEAEPTAEEQAAAEQAAAEAAMRAFEESLTFRTGTIDLPCGKAQLALPDGYRYLGPADADKVLQAWGNLPQPDTEGMVVAAEVSLFADATWAVIVEYSDHGHVDDSDAASTDWNELLAQMKMTANQNNVERRKLGLATAQLIGWAEPPHYDRATHKLYFAKELFFEGNDGNTVNYAVRVLGREGVLELNAVAPTAGLDTVKREMAKLLEFADFTAGNRYTDYRKGVDRNSGYGVAAVVAGGAVAAKVVGSKGFWAILLAAKKLILAGLIAIGVAINSLWSRLARRRNDAEGIAGGGAAEAAQGGGAMSPPENPPAGEATSRGAGTRPLQATMTIDWKTGECFVVAKNGRRYSLAEVEAIERAASRGDRAAAAALAAIDHTPGGTPSDQPVGEHEGDHEGEDEGEHVSDVVNDLVARPHAGHGRTTGATR